MPSWWVKSSSKAAKKKSSKESLIDTFHRKFNIPSDGKLSNRSAGSRRRSSDRVSEKGSKSRVVSRSTSPSKSVARCQSFDERPHPLPVPGSQPAGVGRIDSGISTSSKSRMGKCSKPSSFLSIPRPACIRSRRDRANMDGNVTPASFSSECDSDDPTDSHQRSPMAVDCKSGSRTAIGSPNCSVMPRNQPVMEIKSEDATKQPNQVSLTSSKRRHLSSHVSNLQVPSRGILFSAPGSSLSSPSRSPMRAVGTEQITNSNFWASKAYPDLPSLGSGHCSSSGSGQTSRQNSISGQFLWQPSRSSPEYSPIPSPRMTSPGPSSRIQSGAVTPVHPRVGNLRSDDGKESHPLPMPPVTISNISPFCNSNSAATSPSVPRSPGRAENPTSSGSRWKKGKLLGRGMCGHVYVGFNSEKGEMCAMKEVTLFADDTKSKESAKQLGQEILLLSRLRHPNIVQYFGSEMVDDKLYIYLEYVSGGSIHKLLQEYGQFGESAIRSYTKQILSGLAYLHAKNTLHRDIKGANILVDPNGRVKLADFGMAKHITGQSCPLSLKGSPYWMAPEVIKNSSGCSLAVDIWSLGCTVLEMATGKPPWSQYEGVAAMFKIGNSKDLPTIPDHLSDEGKNFVKRCLQRNPLCRPTAAQLLDHAFVKRVTPFEKPVLVPEPLQPPKVGTGIKAQGKRLARNASNLESERHDIHFSRVSKGTHYSREINIPKNISCPVSPIRSPLLYPRSPQNLNGKLSPSPISTPRATSGSSTPLTGGVGTISFCHLNQSVYLQEGFTSKSKKPPQGATYACNSPCYASPNREMFQGMHSGSQIFWELLSNENEEFGNIFGRHINNGEICDGQTVLADRVSQQLLKDHAKLGPSLDLSSFSPSPRPMI